MLSLQKKFKKAGNLVNEENREIERLNNCNEVKAVLMFSVILYHACAFWKGDWFTCNPVDSSTVLSVFATWLGTFHIYGFTLVSGYIYYYVYYERKGYDSYSMYICKKVKRLLIPYIMIAFIWVIPLQNLFFTYNIGTIIQNYVLGCSPNQLWFLLMLFGVSVLFFPVTNYMKQNSSLFVILLFYMLGFIIEQRTDNYFMIGRALEYMLFFWIGFNIRSGKLGFVWKVPTTIYLVIDFTLFIIIQICTVNSVVYLKLLEYVLKIFINVIGAVMTFIILQRYLGKCSDVIKRIISRFSKISMPMYLFHQQLLYFPIVILNGKTNPIIIAIISFLFSILGATLLSLLFMKYKVTRLIIGEK